MAVLKLLLEHGKISQTTQDTVASFCQKWQVSHYCGLLETNIFSESNLADTLAEILGVSRIFDIEDGDYGPKAREIVPFAIAAHHSLVPIDVYPDNGNVEIVVSDPSCISKLKEQLPEVAWAVTIGELTAIHQAMESLYSMKEQLGL